MRLTALLLVSLLAYPDVRGRAAEPPPSQPAGWPTGWSALYDRFERFLAARREYWPASRLSFDEAGTIFYGLPPSDRLTLSFYRKGRAVLAMGLSRRGLFSDGRSRYFNPGTYAAVLTSAINGYQYHPPIAWFETTRDEDADFPRIRMMEAPSEPEGHWPNERLLAFLDLHVMARHQRDAIEESNKLADPAVVLKATDSGVIERETLANSQAENFLCWRIYHDGRLVKTGSGKDEVRYACEAAGSYSVWMGVEGPAGFLPISNMLHFALFPRADGALERFPQDTNNDEIPDFIEKVGREEPKLKIEKPSSTEDADGDGLSDAEENGAPVFVDTGITNAENLGLLELWEAWKYEIRQEMRQRRSR